MCVWSPANTHISCVAQQRSAILNQPVGTEKWGQAQNDISAGFKTLTFSVWTPNMATGGRRSTYKLNLWKSSCHLVASQGMWSCGCAQEKRNKEPQMTLQAEKVLVAFYPKEGNYDRQQEANQEEQDTGETSVGGVKSGYGKQRTNKTSVTKIKQEVQTWNSKPEHNITLKLSSWDVTWALQGQCNRRMHILDTLDAGNILFPLLAPPFPHFSLL